MHHCITGRLLSCDYMYRFLNVCIIIGCILLQVHVHLGLRSIRAYRVLVTPQGNYFLGAPRESGCQSGCDTLGRDFPQEPGGLSQRGHHKGRAPNPEEEWRDSADGEGPERSLDSKCPQLGVSQCVIGFFSASMWIDR